MFIKLEILEDTVTLTGTVHGKRYEWEVILTSPSGEVFKDQTGEREWHTLYNELFESALADARRSRMKLASGGRR